MRWDVITGKLNDIAAMLPFFSVPFGLDTVYRTRETVDDIVDYQAISKDCSRYLRKDKSEQIQQA